MKEEKIINLLNDFKDGKIGLGKILEKLKGLPYDDIGFAKLDGHRSLRRGFPEVIFCPGKSLDKIKDIVKRLKKTHSEIILARATVEIYQVVKRIIPQLHYFKEARIIARLPKKINRSNFILVVSAGTADIPVAEEAAVTAEIMGNRVERLYDVGVAGIHRLFNFQEKIRQANVLVVVAGMEGALPSVVAGLVDKPVIAVPTSIGYGANFGGVAPLLTMLNSCSPGIGVVNIDNGFGAGYLAGIINKNSH